MTKVDKIKEVRILKEIGGFAIKEIVRRTRLSRNTIRRIVRSGKTKFAYHREKTVQPQTGPFRETIKNWLREDLEKKRKYRRTATRIYEILKNEHGYMGSYESIAKTVQELKKEIKPGPKEVFIPLVFDPGEAFQFDWGEAYAYLAEKLVKVNWGIVVLCHSRHFFVRAYPCQKQELMLDLQQRAFEFFGGLCRRGIYDNLKTAVKKILRGKHPNLQERFVQFCSHYLYEPDFCNPARGNEKGRVENKVGYVRRNFFVPTQHFNSLEELNDRLLTFCISKSHNNKHPDIKDKTCWEVYEQERKCLVQLPPYRFDCCRVTEGVVDSESNVFFENNRYSVPDDGSHNQSMMIKGYADEVVISQDGREVARHKRSYERKKEIYNPYHYLRTLAKKPGAFRNGKPFRDWKLPDVFEEYRRLLNEKYPDGDIYFAKTLVLLRDWPIKDVVSAIQKAVATKILGDSYILSILRQNEETGFKECAIDIKADLAKYQARQKPLSDYSEILFQRKGDRYDGSK